VCLWQSEISSTKNLFLMNIWWVADLSDCGGEANCIGSEGVLRLSLGCFVSSFWSSMNFSVQLLICSIHDGTLSRDFLRVSGLICLGDKMWNLGRSLTNPI
jgi:hypothetical protein